MHVVGIMEAAAGATSHAEELARTLGGGMTALELRMAMSAVHPNILFRTASREQAEHAADVLAARGVRAVAIDLAVVPSLETMVSVRHFVLETTGLRADTQGPTLAYDAMAAIVRVAVETSVWRTTRETESKVSVRGTRVNFEVQRTRAEHAIEQVLFLFVRDEGVPWVLRAGEARYRSLGASLRPTVIENFMATLALLRERAPRAVYDERFVAHPFVRKAETHVRGHDTVSPGLEDEGIEVRMHLLAQVLGRGSHEGPYR
jgi:hypothetical protein